MKINDIEYIELEKYNELEKELKEAKIKTTSKNIAKRFGESDTLKLIKALSSLFTLESESVNEDFVVENGVSVIDPANVCMVEGKSEEAKRILSMFKSFESKTKNDVTLDYKNTEGEISKSKFSQEYLLKIMNVLKITSDGINISVKHDYPVTIENKDFKFILAPRVENGDE